MLTLTINNHHNRLTDNKPLNTRPKTSEHFLLIPITLHDHYIKLIQIKINKFFVI